MNELEQKIADLITNLESGIEFGKGQAPIIVEQLLRYELIFAFLWLSVCAFIAFAIGYNTYKFMDSIGDTVALGTIITGVMLVPITANITTIVKIWVAPNLFVLDYLRGMI